MGMTKAAVTVAAGVLALAGCVQVQVPTPMPAPPVPAPAGTAPLPAAGGPSFGMGSPQAAARTFVQVVQQMEPVIERECLQRRTRPINCDFQFVVDDRPSQEPNAFQTIDRAGRPIIGFTLSLIAAAQNRDELAFVVGHEASHHILNHLDQKSRTSTAGAVILGGAAAVYSGNPAAVDAARRVGATLGSRYYSKEWELEADYLGAVITMNAGFDPQRGAAFFARMPDPGNRVLGSHPSNAARVGQVSQAVADVRAGRIR